MTTPFNSKPFAASDTGSEDKLFHAARLRLAGISTLILVIIVLGFSYILYRSFALNLQDTVEGDFADAAAQQRVIYATLSAEWRDILLGDAVLILIAAGAAYAFAGRTLRPVRQAVETQKNFAAHASHELRTPLAVVKNELEVLARNPRKTDADVDSALKNSLEEIVRMSEMTDNLLALARSEQGKPYTRERVDLDEILVAVLKSANNLAKTKGVDLQREGSGPVVVSGNRAELERSILNILRNAIEHTSAGGTVALTLSALPLPTCLTSSNASTKARKAPAAASDLPS